jgi:hypothetical protein
MPRFVIRWWWLPLVALVLAACSGSATAPAEPVEPTESAANTTTAETDSEPAADEAADASEPTAASLPDEPPPPGVEREFSTDFSQRSIAFDEVLSGGPPKDGIPSIDDPQFVSVEEADTWLEDDEPVVRIEAGGVAKAYPLQILTWHEIVNDTVGGVPITVTFCPLCNTAIAFERTVNGQVLDFGTTGRLRFSNLIMYDRQTETWWQQATGEGIVGELTDTQLAFYPAEMIAWSDFRQTHPDGKVLSRDTGYDRDYGRNPYAGYDDINSTPFLYEGPTTPGELPAMARVLTVEHGDTAVAYPYEVLQEQRVINDTVNNTEIAVFWESGTASALDTGTIASGRDVGAANAYLRELDGQTLTFALEDGQIIDQQTGSVWNARGQSISGELEGQELEPVVAINHFWFSWAAFKPETRIYQPS